MVEYINNDPGKSALDENDLTLVNLLILLNMFIICVIYASLIKLFFFPKSGINKRICKIQIKKIIFQDY